MALSKQPRTRIAGTVAAQVLSKGIDKSYARQIAAYLMSERRIGELDSILRDVQADWAAAGYVEVLAHSAHDLSPESIGEIESRIRTLFPEADKVVVTVIPDPEVVGGVRLSLADRQLDMSVEAKLNKFKQLTAAGKDS